MTRTRKVLTAIAVALTATVALLVPASSAQAVPSGCTSGWSGWYSTFASPHWGQFQWCRAQEFNYYYYQFQVQDIYTDGYAVHLEACDNLFTGYECTDANGNWLGRYGLIITDSGPSDPCPQSSGSIDTTQFPALVAYTPGTGPSYVAIRLVRGRCEGGAYQSVDSVAYTINF